MKKIGFLYAVLYGFCFYAQPSVKWGPLLQNVNAGSNHMWVAAEDSECIYTLKQRVGFRAKELWYLEAINKQNKKVIFSKPILPPFDKEKNLCELNAVFAIDSKLFVFGSAYNESGKTLSCYAAPIDKYKGITGESKEICSVIVDKSEYKPYFNYVLSPGKNKLLISSSPFNAAKDEIKIFDENLKPVWGGKLNFDGVPLEINYYKVFVNNEGDFVIYSTKYNQLEDLTFDGKIILYSQSKSKFKTIRILAPQPFSLYDETVMFYDSSKVYFVGLLKTTINYLEVTGGVISASLDMEKQQLINTQTVFFDQKNTEELMGINRGWQDEGGPYFKVNLFKQGKHYYKSTFYLKDVLLRQDHTFSLLLQQEISYSSSFPDRYNYYFNNWTGGYQPYYQYMTLFDRYNYYNNVVNSGQPYYQNISSINAVKEYQSNLISIINLKENGDINWLKMIPKSQRHVKEEYLSFVSAFDDKFIYLIYNDHKRNVSNRKPFSPIAMGNPKKAVAVITAIDNEGNIKTDPFYWPKRNLKLTLKPAVSFRNGSNAVFLFTERKTKYRLGEITFK